MSTNGTLCDAIIADPISVADLEEHFPAHHDAQTATVDREYGER